MVASTLDWTEKAEMVLITRPPSFEVDLVGTGVKGDIITVDLADYPEWPDWQFRDPVPIAYVPPWITDDVSRWQPVPHEETSSATRFGLNLARALIGKLRAKPLIYRSCRLALRNLWLHVCLHSAGGTTIAGNPMSDVDRVLLTSMAVFRISRLVEVKGAPENEPPRLAFLDNAQPLIKRLQENAQYVRESIRRCLRAVGVAPHHWIEEVALGLLMHPHGSTWVQMPVNLGLPTGDTELERGIEVALGVPDSVYRTANKVQRSYLKRYGFEPERKPHGPARGSKQRPLEAWSAFENYVRMLSRKGISPSFICQEAEAQRLYRLARSDRDARLKESAVRRVLRKQAE